MDIEKYVDELTSKALDAQRSIQCTNLEESMETVLKDRAIELWSDSAGRLFFVADETDARRTIELLGARRGEIYTATEARRIVAVKDPAVVAEIHDWKRRFDGAVREFRAGEQAK